MAAPEDHIDQLYEVPLESFVSARDALAARLRAAGERDAATEVKRLKKPSVAAWAVNQLVRTERARVEELWELGDRLRSAQAKVLGGAGADELRVAAEAERDVVAHLVEAAAAILEASGHAASDAQRERVASTLHAAATTQAGRDALRPGRLTRELEPAGFGAMAGLEPPAAGEGPAPPREPDDATSRRQLTAALRRRRDEACRAAEERARQADAAEKEADRLERRAGEAERAAARAREAARSARDAAREARRQADEAARRALEIGEDVAAETA